METQSVHVAPFSHISHRTRIFQRPAKHNYLEPYRDIAYPRLEFQDL